MKLNRIFLLLCMLPIVSGVLAQIRLIDFDKAKQRSANVDDAFVRWKTEGCSLLKNGIEGTPSLVLQYSPKAPFAKAKTTLIKGGCKYLSFDFRRLDGGNCDVIVLVNNYVVATIDQTNGFVQTMAKIPVFTSGSFEIAFQQRGEKSGSIAIDNLLWTPCTKEESVIYSQQHEIKAPKGNLIFEGDFERGNLDNFSLAGNLKNCLVTMPTRSGKYALRSVVDRYDKDVPFRCELVAKQQNTRQNYLYQEIGMEYWYGFSTYLPNGWVIDNQTDIIAQFHGTPDEGEAWFVPNLGLHITENHYEIHRFWDAQHITNWAKRDGEDHYNFGNVTNDVGHWVDWVFNIKWDYRKEGVGFTKIWKDGVLIFDKAGPNCTNDDLGPFLRFGLYKWDWKHPEEEKPSTTTNRVIYHDEYRIGNANSSYQEVAPLGLSPNGKVELIKER